MENGIFGSEIGSEFGEPGGIPLTRIPRSTPGGLDHNCTTKRIEGKIIDGSRNFGGDISVVSCVGRRVRGDVCSRSDSLSYWRGVLPLWRFAVK